MRLSWSSLDTVPGREWKSPPAARIKEIRMAYDKGTVTVNEYRREAFNLPPFEIDAPWKNPQGERRRTPASWRNRSSKVTAL
jgi:hypothetical protein